MCEQSAARLVEPVAAVSVVSDVETVVALRESGQPVPEQLLPDFYAEHITLAMNKERRRQVLNLLPYTQLSKLLD